MNSTKQYTEVKFENWIIPKTTKEEPEYKQYTFDFKIQSTKRTIQKNQHCKPVPLNRMNFSFLLNH